MDSPPSKEELDALVNRQGRRNESWSGVKNWICPTCKHCYPHIPNLLADLPVDDCMYCGIENEADFDFKMFDSKINAIDVSIPVLDQSTTEYCTIFATISSASLSRKVSGAFDWKFLGETLDWTDLLRKYEKKIQNKFGYEDYPDVTRIYHLHALLKTEGVAYKRKSILQSLIDPNTEVFKCDRFWEVDKNDFSYITRLLASGFPLVTSIAVGEKFATARDEMCNPPPYCRLFDVGATAVTHAVLLVGAGRSRGVKYYWVFNSWGEGFDCHGMAHVIHTGILTNPGEGFDCHGMAHVIHTGILTNPVGMTIASYLS